MPNRDKTVFCKHCQRDVSVYIYLPHDDPEKAMCRLCKDEWLRIERYLSPCQTYEEIVRLQRVRFNYKFNCLIYKRRYLVKW